MRINTNTAALNSYNQLNNTNNKLSKSLSRLSSGKRINGAADDAAGLAISEKMGAQTRGLAQAQRNAQDGISMIQTAEGALKESHSILQRMRELSVQSANDTNTSEDRAEIQKEVDELAGELTRISNNTEFNTQTLLNGAIEEDAKGEAVFQIGANKDQNININMSAMDAESLGVAADSIDEAALDSGATDIGAADLTSASEFDFGETITVSSDGSGGITLASDASGTTDVTFSGVSDGDTIQGTGDFEGLSIDITTANSASGTITMEGTEATAATFSGGELSAEAAAAAGIDVSSQESANNAVETIDSAIEKVSAERSKLGASQNRLDHTINNLNTAEENLTAAESRISDVDMAREMMNMSKQQILSQAGTAMMAQANQLPQGVLQLLG